MKKEIFLIPYAHLDTQWRWEYPTTIKKYIKSTLNKNISLFENYPDHQFNFTGAIRYDMMKEYYPGEFNQIKKYIEEGRWHIAGTCMDETDALIPGVESMVRNILYGKRWAMREFGKSSSDYMIPDCFGFPGNMPTVLTHCDIKGFSTQKLTWQSAAGIPFEIGIWRGKDGSELVSALNPGAYITHIRVPIRRRRHSLKKLKVLGEKSGIWKSFQYYGVGDIGGAPKEGSVKKVLASIEHSQSNETDLKVRQGSPDQFFAELKDDERDKMERYEGDFLLTHHSAGTLTSAAVMKRWNRKNEQLAFAAEAAALTAMKTTGSEYPSNRIATAWRCVLGSQMHDILPGTSTPSAYNYAHNDEVIALKLWSSILEDSAQAIAPHVKGDGNILVYNPCELRRKDPVKVDLSTDDEIKGKSGECILIDAEGRETPGQISSDKEGRTVLTFIPELAPFSWSRFTLHEDKTSVETPVSVRKSSGIYLLENARYKITVSEDGEIRSILHKELSKELLSAPMAYEFQKEVPGVFPAWNMDWKDRQKEPFARIVKGGTVSISEEGPQRCAISIKIEYGSSSFIKEISLSAGSDIVEFSEKINWRESGCSLKLALRSDMKNSKFTTNWESSRAQRDVNHKKIYEMPSRYWADLSCADDWGFSILEDSKYGYDHPSENTLRMTLLYTPGLKFFDPFRDQNSQDWGEHTIRYALYGHKGDWKNSDVQARRFNQPVRPFLITDSASAKSSAVKNQVELFKISSESIGVLAVKKAEDSEAAVVRLYERKGEASTADLIFSNEITKVQAVNGLEEVQGDIKIVNNSFTATLSACSMASYLVEFAEARISPVLKQHSIDLPYNIRTMAPRGERTEALFPLEQIPSHIFSSDIKYYLAGGRENDTLSCGGQEISFPEGYNSLSILCGGNTDHDAVFSWLDKYGDILNKKDISIPSMTDFIGQWDKRIWKKTPRHEEKQKRDYLWLNKCSAVNPGYIKRERLEWFSTHTLKKGEPQPYQFGYMFTKILNIPKNAVCLQLPADQGVNIFAMTVSERNSSVLSAQYLIDKYDF
jgi:alpha-mannosidase